jgi:hypothetical protein
VKSFVFSDFFHLFKLFSMLFHFSKILFFFPVVFHFFSDPILSFFQIIRWWCLIKPLLKHSTQTIFQGGIPWITQILNNIIVWMVPYCAQQLVGVKKESKLSSIEFNWKSIESKLKPIESKLISTENQLKVNWNQLIVNWFQLKSLLKLTILKIVGGGQKKCELFSILKK